MMRQTFIPANGLPWSHETNAAEWHRMRAQNLTTGDMATLFNRNPYQSLSKLWNLKKAHQVDHRPDNPQMARGRLREPLVAKAVAQIRGWKVEPMLEFMVLPEVRIACSFDFKAHFIGGWCPDEVKTASVWVVTKGYWTTQGDNLTYTGPRIELQLQTEAMVSGSQGCYLSAETDDGRKWWGARKADPLVQQMMLDRAGEFWKAFDKDMPLPGVRVKNLKAVA